MGFGWRATVAWGLTNILTDLLTQTEDNNEEEDGDKSIKMRCATDEERQSVEDHIKSISKT